MLIAVPGHFCHNPWDKTRTLTSRSPLPAALETPLCSSRALTKPRWSTVAVALGQMVCVLVACSKFFPLREEWCGVKSPEGEALIIRAMQGKTWLCPREGSNERCGFSSGVAERDRDISLQVIGTTFLGTREDCIEFAPIRNTPSWLKLKQKSSVLQRARTEWLINLLFLLSLP